MITKKNGMFVALGFFMLLAAHTFVVYVASVATSETPLNGDVVALTLLGVIQVAYALPLIVVFGLKKRPIAVGVFVCAVLTGVMTMVALGR